MSNDQHTQDDHPLDADCLEAFDHVYAYINNELKDPVILARIEHHLSHCESCFSRAEMERRINDRIKATEKPKSPDSLSRRLDDLLGSLDD